jgi:hypothetical protein
VYVNRPSALVFGGFLFRNGNASRGFWVCASHSSLDVSRKTSSTAFWENISLVVMATDKASRTGYERHA